MNAFQLKKIALTLSLSAALSAQAAGLGVMTSSSKLGEPLNAEIELLAVAPNELSSIQAALASEQFYQDQLLEKPNAYPFIKIEVASSPNGQPILKLSSSQPITEAFLDMLIQVDWPTGRLVKEYTLLLDPPGINTANVTEPLNLPNTATEEKMVPAVAPKANVAPVSTNAETEAADKQSVVVKAGDNLHQLAEQLRPDNVTHTQMLAALYQANPQAFDGQNMNRLKVGKVLRMPSPDRLAAMDQAQALRIVNAHLSQWQAYKNGLAGAVKTAAPSAQVGNAQSSTGKVQAPQPTEQAPAPATKDVLKLSAGDRPNTPADNGAKKALEAKITGLQEDLIAKENAIQEEKSRALALEKQLDDMKKLLALKNDAMAKLQANAANPPASASNAIAPNASVNANPETTQPPAKGIDTSADTTQANTADESAGATNPLSAPQAANSPPASTDTTISPPPGATPVAPSSAPDTAQPDAAVPESQFTNFLAQRLKHMHPSLWVGLVVLPILGILWLWTRVRRKKQINTFEEAIMTSPATEMQSNTVFGHTQATTGDTSFLTDFSQSAVGGMIDAHEVDPIAEAEVYMAYGRDAQAEEILKDAMQKDPRRQELKAKLLEIYQATNNAAAFDSLAETLHAQIDPNTELWRQVTAMGRQMNPQHALYRDDVTSATSTSTRLEETDFTRNTTLNTDVAVTASTADVDDLAFSMPEMAASSQLQPKPITLPALDFEEATAPTEATHALQTSGEATLADSDTAFDRLPELSFALDTPSGTDKKIDTAVENQEESLDTPLSMTALSMSDTPVTPDTADAAGKQADQSFDLMLGDVNLDDLTLNDQASPATNALEALEMTLDDANESPSANDEVDTKLDLIKAYIDMEDAIGARELIEEVMTEGNPAQQALAETLLKKIA